eukprot:scaffold29056_cov42-Prasinocladus_malaysianus.AAC.1
MSGLKTMTLTRCPAEERRPGCDASAGRCEANNHMNRNFSAPERYVYRLSHDVALQATKTLVENNTCQTCQLVKPKLRTDFGNAGIRLSGRCLSEPHPY